MKKLPAQTEASFQKQVMQLAKLRGWMVAHFRPARVMVRGVETWRTPCEGDAAGFPDLVLARRGSVMFRELKSDVGKISEDQQRWILAVGGKIWRPCMWPMIEKELW